MVFKHASLNKGIRQLAFFKFKFKERGFNQLDRHLYNLFDFLINRVVFIFFDTFINILSCLKNERMRKMVFKVKLDNGNNNKRSYYPRKIKRVIPTSLNASIILIDKIIQCIDNNKNVGRDHKRKKDHRLEFNKIASLNLKHGNYIATQCVNKIFYCNTIYGEHFIKPKMNENFEFEISSSSSFVKLSLNFKHQISRSAKFAEFGGN
ncbi:hypothetical protein BpHYR1_043820 [Brachionus plicatilis]|uniref:Uncharacterized protein n=1 Tax=Brachionus plicatilis TaxID=10195 RepID=A0A3M7RWB0_BRAPC|nr:hypothetical protein BpHYR1_043820 [Brachionus plicatilis]